jgi:Mn2+/Fe2+ NRAMP family transporter
MAVSAALANACGLGIANLTGGVIPQSWGAAGHSLLGAAFVLLGGFSGFEKIMKVLIGAMFFAIVACALMAVEDRGAVLSGLLLPRIPEGGGAYVLSLIGGIGGSVTLLSYNYWLREEGIATPAYARFVRKDLAIAYGFTAVFGISIMTMSSRAFHSAGIEITDGKAVTTLAEMLGTLLGPAGFYIYSIGFWAAVFAALLGVWQSVPYLYADFYAIWKNVSSGERAALTQVGSRPYRLALAYVSLAPIPFAFAGRPLFIIVVYTIVGSLFLPFLAATLLWLHRRATWDPRVPRNGWITTALLVLVLLLFAAIGVREIREAL